MRVNLALAAAPDVEIFIPDNYVIDKIKKIMQSGHYVARWDIPQINDKRFNPVDVKENLTCLEKIYNYETLKGLIARKYMRRKYGVVEIKVPNSITVKIINCQKNLKAYKKQIGKKLKVFNNKSNCVAASTTSIISAMLRDGDRLEAIEFADGFGITLGYGTNKHSGLSVYSDVEFLSMRGIDMFIGRENGRQYEVISVESGLYIQQNYGKVTKKEWVKQVYNVVVDMTDGQIELAVESIKSKSCSQTELKARIENGS